MVCAPFLALRVLRQLINDEGPHFPRAQAVLSNNIYVDDVLFGGDNAEDLRQTRDELVTLLLRGGFELRKWASNHPLLLSDIDAADHGLACSKPLAADESVKIVGLRCNPTNDGFQFIVSLPNSAPTRKRTILSTIAKLFDPLGWVTPVIVTAKIFMQHLWRASLGWDDELPSPIRNKWERIYSKLSYLNGLKILRWAGLSPDTVHAELHGFADASNSAYAAVVYLKVIPTSGCVSITLLASKSHVAQRQGAQRQGAQRPAVGALRCKSVDAPNRIRSQVLAFGYTEMFLLARLFSRPWLGLINIHRDGKLSLQTGSPIFSTIAGRQMAPRRDSRQPR